MSSLASSMEFESKKVSRHRTYDFQRVMANRQERREHEECGETAFYPLSPVALAFYYGFDYDTEPAG
ncbi:MULTISPECIES: hypothetical protein [Paenibacillus]|uniref:Uncharacterized protein n=1 Tax=Paenibacillus violae TaxID=3077234 RepID=A0ABU3RH61_9BACL|nr:MULTISPECIES: hypothetical protein [Paenibacillus]MDU0203625.1 hypothetical protein [Paenibacillus sp. PFR10]MEC0267558.1 hypothetical protein [Paenibacillus anseongense]